MCHLASEDLQAEKMLDLHRNLTDTTRLLLQLLQNELRHASSAARNRDTSRAEEEMVLRRNNDLLQSTTSMLEDFRFAVLRSSAEICGSLDHVGESMHNHLRDLQSAAELFSTAMQDVRPQCIFGI